MDEPDPRLVELAHQMFDCARAGETQTLIAHVDAGVPVDLTDAAGNTLLMLAAYHGQASTVAALIDHGASVDAVNDRNHSPLAGAIFKGEESVIDVLLNAGGDVDAGSPSARQTAAQFGAEHLLERRSDG